MQLDFVAKFEVLSVFDGFAKFNIVGNKVDGKIIEDSSLAYGLNQFSATEYAALTGILSGKPSLFSSRPEEFGLINVPGGFVIHGRDGDQIKGHFDGTGVINFLSFAESISGRISITDGKNQFKGVSGTGHLIGDLFYNPLTRNSNGVVIIRATLQL